MAAPSTPAMVEEVEATRKALEALADRYTKSLQAATLKLKTLRGNVTETVEERDRLVRESALVLSRGETASAASLSTQRVDQIRGGKR